MDRSKWKYKKLGDVATFLNGYAFKPDNWSEHGLKIIRIQNLTDENALYNCYNGDIDPKYIVHKGDLLISWSATLGAFIWNNDDALLNQHIFKTIFDKSDIDKFYLRYCVISKLEEFSKKAHGITMRHITKKDFDNTIIPVPCIADQQRIVAELDCLNEMIALKQEQLKEFDKLAQSIFYDMFGDPYINDKGWNIKPFSEIALAKTGITYKPDNVKDSGIIVLRSSNVQGDELAFEDVVRVDLPISEKYHVQNGDILMCSRNGSARLVGKTAKIMNVNEIMTWGAFMTIIRSKYNDYLLQYFKTDAFRNSLASSKTTTVHQITIGMLNALNVPLPPLALQQQFAEKIQAIEEQKELVKKSIAETQQLLDSRMDYYFD